MLSTLAEMARSGGFDIGTETGNPVERIHPYCGRNEANRKLRDRLQARDGNLPEVIRMRGKCTVQAKKTSNRDEREIGKCLRISVEVPVGA